jgi:hypothetical protein
MNATYDEKAGTLTIVLKCGTPRPSATGKTLVIATSGGNQPTTANYDGQPIIVGVNAYVRR